MNKQEFIQRLVGLRDTEIWAIRNFKRCDFESDTEFLRFLNKRRKESEAYTTALKLAEQLDEPKECEVELGADGRPICGCCKRGLFIYVAEHIIDLRQENFCPNCGAKIKREN